MADNSTAAVYHRHAIISALAPVFRPGSALAPRRWSLGEYEATFEAGILTRASRFELLDGSITEMLGTGSVHDLLVRSLLGLLCDRLPADREIGCQSPIRILPHSRPEPDLWVARRGSGRHKDHMITAADVAIVIVIESETRPGMRGRVRWRSASDAEQTF